MYAIDPCSGEDHYRRYIGPDRRGLVWWLLWSQPSTVSKMVRSIPVPHLRHDGLARIGLVVKQLDCMFLRTQCIQSIRQFPASDPIT